MNEPLILAAASMWAAGYDTQEIADKLGLKQFEVARHIERIKEACRAVRKAVPA